MGTGRRLKGSRKHKNILPCEGLPKGLLGLLGFGLSIGGKSPFSAAPGAAPGTASTQLQTVDTAQLWVNTTPNRGCCLNSGARGSWSFSFCLLGSHLTSALGREPRLRAAWQPRSTPTPGRPTQPPGPVAGPVAVAEGKECARVPCQRGRALPIWQQPTLRSGDTKQAFRASSPKSGRSSKVSSLRGMTSTGSRPLLGERMGGLAI